MARATGRAVILAAGAGRRMRLADPSTDLDRRQAEAADAGLKGLVPIGGRPFLDYVADALADAGVEEACLVTPPVAPELVRWASSRERPFVEIAVQVDARGTADALLAAGDFVGKAPFLMVNSDNLYPVEGLRRLAAVAEGGVLTVERARAAADRGNLDDRRLAEYAVLEVDADDRLLGLREKPGLRAYRRLADPVLLGVNGWRFNAAILDACRRVRPSSRGELELPAAVALAIAAGEQFEVVRAREPILDLSTRADVAAVERALAEVAR